MRGKLAVAAVVLLVIGDLTLLAVIYRSLSRAREETARLRTALHKRQNVTGTVAVLNCFQPLQSQPLRTGGLTPSGPGEFLLTCTREAREDGLRFYVEVGNPFSVTYQFASFSF